MPITISGDTPNFSAATITTGTVTTLTSTTGTITTLTTTTLSDGTNSTSSTNAIQGSAKAWVNFNGTGTVAIRGSYNVSSITDNGTGDYTVNFTNAFADTNYAVSMAGGRGDGAGVSASLTQIYSTVGNAYTSLTTTSARLSTAASNGTALDIPVVCASFFR